MITSQGKLTPELIKQVTAIIQQGNYPEVACAAHEISERTMQRWMARGNKILEEIDNNPDIAIPESEKLYIEFVTLVKKASALGEIADVQVINDGDKSAIPRLAKLSRRHRKRWAETVQDQDQLRTGAEFLARLVEALQRPQLKEPTLIEIQGNPLP